MANEKKCADCDRTYEENRTRAPKRCLSCQKERRNKQARARMRKLRGIPEEQQQLLEDVWQWKHDGLPDP